MEVNLDELDQQLLRRIAKFYVEHGDPNHLGAEILSLQQLLDSHPELDETRLRQKLSRFESYGWLKVHLQVPNLKRQNVRAEPALLGVLEELDNPPPPDHWEGVTKWAKSKRWFVALMLLTIGVPWAIGIITAAKTILTWFGVLNQ